MSVHTFLLCTLESPTSHCEVHNRFAKNCEINRELHILSAFSHIVLSTDFPSFDFSECENKLKDKL